MAPRRRRRRVGREDAALDAAHVALFEAMVEEVAPAGHTWSEEIKSILLRKWRNVLGMLASSIRDIKISTHQPRLEKLIRERVGEI